jgi:hypothetical protein
MRHGFAKLEKPSLSLFPCVEKDCFGESPKPTRDPRVLPRHPSYPRNPWLDSLVLLFLAEFLESGITAQGAPEPIEPKKGRRDGHSVVIQPSIGRPQQPGEIRDRRAVFTEDCLNYRREFFAGRALSPIFSIR